MKKPKAKLPDHDPKPIPDPLEGVLGPHIDGITIGDTTFESKDEYAGMDFHPFDSGPFGHGQS